MTWKKGVFAKSKSDMRGVGTTVCMKKKGLCSVEYGQAVWLIKVKYY